MKRTKKERLALIKKGMGIGAVAMAAILQGKGLEATLAIVKKNFPKAKMGANSYHWYRSELRRLGQKVPDLARPAAEKKEGKHKVEVRRVARLAPAAPAAARKAAAQ